MRKDKVGWKKPITFTIVIITLILVISSLPLNTVLGQEELGNKEPKGWSEDVRLTYANDSRFFPDIAVSSNYVHVVWQDVNDTGRVYYKRSTNNGVNWGNEKVLSVSTGSILCPKLATNGTNVYMVWQNRTGGDKYEICFKKSADNGETWGGVSGTYKR